jgi:drug/metabolite transporter (DMT)-like permease
VGHALGEPMGLMRLAGVLMISLGVAIVARS